MRIAVGVGAAFDGEERCVEFRRIGSVQRRVGVEYLHAAHRQHEERERDDPMGETHDHRVAVNSPLHLPSINRISPACTYALQIWMYGREVVGTALGPR